MGGHYGSIHVRTEEADQLRAALEDIAREHGTKTLLAPAIGGWTTAFPNEHGQEFGVARALATRILAPILHCVVHDDDVFAYQFFENGVLIDEYNSCPDYFGGPPAPRGGNVQILEKFLASANAVGALQNLLDAERFDFEMKRLDKFAELLGLPNAVTAYEYLQNGERYDIKRWREFIHIPDLTAEKAAKRAAKAQARAQIKRLLKAGILRHDQTGAKTSHRLFPGSPIWCIDPSCGDVLLAWTGNPVGMATTTSVNRIDIKTGATEATGIVVSSRVCCLAASLNGRWLAAGCAYGDWKTQLCDRSERSLTTEYPQNRAVGQVAFRESGQSLFSLSEKAITIATGPELEIVETIQLTEHGRTMAAHPEGEYLVIDSRGSLAIIHAPTRAEIKTVWIKPRQKDEPAIVEELRQHGIGEHLQELGSRVPAAELEKERTRLIRHSRPKQSVFSMTFSRDGSLLICGTNEGVCVFDWRGVLDCSDQSPIIPKTFVEAEAAETDDGLSEAFHKLIYSVVHDADRNRVLFAGLEGKVRFLELAEGLTGDLLVPPFRMPFWRLDLTPDRTSLVGTATKVGTGKPEPQRFQIWNYPALCKLAGIPF